MREMEEIDRRDQAVSERPRVLTPKDNIIKDYGNQ
jgi:hypothetical protein